MTVELIAGLVLHGKPYQSDDDAQKNGQVPCAVTKSSTMPYRQATKAVNDTDKSEKMCVVVTIFDEYRLGSDTSPSPDPGMRHVIYTACVDIIGLLTTRLFSVLR